MSVPKKTFASAALQSGRGSRWLYPLSFAVVTLLLAVLPARAQWATQTVILQPGWNAVYLEVQPEPRECDSVLGGLPIESVWAWNRRVTTVQFLQDASKLIPGGPDWLTYFPVAQGNATMTTLFAMHGGRSYLIKSTAVQPVTWRIHGRPVNPSRDWIKGSLNLAGFSLDQKAPPTFAGFFASSPAHAGQAIFRLQPSGAWERVASPSATSMRSGEAFWIYTAAGSTFAGASTVELEQAAGLEYGRTLPETTLTLRNASSVARTFTFQPLPSDDAPDYSLPAVAGVVPLSVWRMNLSGGQYGFFPLEAGASITLGAGATTQLRVAVRRQDMLPYQVVAGPSDYQYQSLLQVTDGAGSRVLLGVTARGGQSTASQSAVAGAPPPPPAADTHAGLWVGTAVIRAVSQPSNANDPLTPRKTGSEAQFRIIVHVNEAGQSRLLQQVMLMWTNGVADSQGNLIRDGRRVLITDDSLLARFTGAALRDGRPVGRRISSVAFSNARPVPMSGPFGDYVTPLGCTVLTGYDDPLNPFKHRFHPDHDNLDDLRTKVLSDGAESYTINRQISLKFTEADPEGVATSRWGDDQLGGVYSETITGIHRSPIVIQGIFRLNHVSLIPFLDNES